MLGIKIDNQGVHLLESVPRVPKLDPFYSSLGLIPPRGPLLHVVPFPVYLQLFLSNKDIKSSN